MADLAYTAANVAHLGNGSVVWGISGGNSLIAGAAVWLDPVTFKLRLTTQGADPQLSHRIVGIVLAEGKTDQPVPYAISGDIDFGGGVTVGASYWLSEGDGKLKDTHPVNPNYSTLVGIGISTTTVRLGFIISDVIVP